MTPPGVQVEQAATVRPDDEEATLWRDLRGSGAPAAREALFSRHLPFARQIAARRYRQLTTADVEFEDLVQLACTGLLEAIDRYDPALGVPFRGYAAKPILGRVLDGLAKASEVRGQIAFRARLGRERMRSLSDTEPREGAPDALTRLVDLAVGLAIGFMLDEATSTLEAADRQPNAYESLAWKETLRRLATEVETLGERERLVLRHHYFNGMQFDQVAGLLGLSKGRVSQMHRAALTTLKTRMRRHAVFETQK